MSNTFLIKRGSGEPNIDKLEEYQLGWSTTEKELFIRDNNEIFPINKTKVVNIQTSLLLVSGAEEIIISGLSLNDNSTIFIDINYALADDNQIKNFRKADIVYLSYTSTTLTLKIRKPRSETELGASELSIPIIMTVVN